MKRQCSFWIAVLAISLLSALPTAARADLTWDAMPDNGVVDQGGGTWVDGGFETSWTADGGVTNVLWDNSSPTIAQFGVDESSTEYDIAVGVDETNEVIATGLRFFQEYRMQGPGTIILQGTGDPGSKVAEIVANARCEFLGAMSNTEDTDKIIIRRDQKAEDANYSGYIEWGGIGSYSCVVQIGDDTGDPALAKNPMLYSGTAINDDCPEVRVMPNSRIYVRTGHVFGAPLTINGPGYGGEGASDLYLFSSNAGWGGDITLNTDSIFTSRATDAGRTYVNSDISEAAGDPKSLTLNNVTYSPTTEVAGVHSYTGDFIIRDNDPSGPSYTVLLKASGSLASPRSIDVGEYTTLDVTEHAGWTVGASVTQTLKGNGTVTGTVTVVSGSTIAPGDSVGTLTIANGDVVNGDLDMFGTWAVEFDGTDNSLDLLTVESDLDVTGGTISLDGIGTLEIGHYHIGTYGGTVTGEAARAGLQTDDWEINYSYDDSNEIHLIVKNNDIIGASPVLIPGDADMDDDVDKDDAARLAENWGATELNPAYDTWWEMGDFDDDELVGPADASILAANFGYGTGEASAVPEPSALAIAFAGLLSLAVGARKKYHV